MDTSLWLTFRVTLYIMMLLSFPPLEGQ